MRLASKVSLALAVAAVLSAVVTAAGFQWLLSPRYERLDREAAVDDAERVSGTIDDALRSLAGANRDWGHWDATYDFMADGNGTYVDENLKHTDLSNIDIDALVFVGDDGKVKFQRAFDPASGESEVWFPVGAPFNLSAWAPFTDDDLSAERTGLVVFEGQVAMVSATPILTSAKTGPARGTLVFVRLLTAERIDELEDNTQLVIKLLPYGEAQPLPGAGEMSFTVEDEVTRLVVPRGDMAGKITVAAETTTPRRFREIANAEFRSVIIGVSVSGIALFFAGLMILSHFITRPLERLSRHLGKVEATGVPAPSGLIHGADEIGDVGRGFDRMIASLKQSRRHLEEQSYFSGMADLSAGVIHNVRNALSPINTAVWSAGRALEEIRVERLAEAGRDLQDPASTPERRALLVEHVIAVGVHAMDSKAILERAHDRIAAYSAQINDILSNYDDIGLGRRTPESVPVVQLVEEAARFARSAQSLPVELTVKVATPPSAAVNVQRIVAAQIVANIVANALDSIRRANRVPGRIEIEAAMVVEHPHARAQISFTDNGEGLPDGEIETIFERNFSHRRDRAGGLGLYWCVRAAATFDGIITAERRPDGARFTISFPLAPNSASRVDHA